MIILLVVEPVYLLLVLRGDLLGLGVFQISAGELDRLYNIQTSIVGQTKED